LATAGLDYGLARRRVGLLLPVGSRIFSSPRRPHRPCVYLTYYRMGRGVCLPDGKNGRGVKLTTHLHLVPNSVIEYTLANPVRVNPVRDMKNAVHS
jgi:hypothetical protein